MSTLVMMSSYYGLSSDFWMPKSVFLWQTVFSLSYKTEIIFNTSLIFKYIVCLFYCVVQGILLGVMWQSGWEGSLGENGYMYMHSWVPLLSNAVNQLYYNIKQNF